MPIEIRELVIKASVDSAACRGGTGNSSSGNSGSENQIKIVNLCVEKVLEQLKLKSER